MLSFPESPPLPAGVGEDEILLLLVTHHLGRAKRPTMWLARTSPDGKSRGPLQPYLDVAALDSEKTIRNPRRQPVVSNRTLRLPGIDDE